MTSGEDRDRHDAPASHADLIALTLRVAALEAQLAALTLPAPSVPAIPIPEPPPRPITVIPPVAVTGPAIPYVPPPPPRSLEDRLGAQIFNIIGAAALIIGASWALKLAIDHGLIGPVARILIGLATGVALILWSERFRRRNFSAFSFSLKAVGSGVLYLSLWACFQLYHLLPADAVFAAMLLVTAWNAFMAWSQDAELLASYALAGGLATPLLLSTGGDHEAFLFLYLATLDAATVLLLRSKPWPRLIPPAFLATVTYFAGWYIRFFHPVVYPGARQAPLFTRVWDAQSTETALFTLLFAAIFALPSLRLWIIPRTPSPLDEDLVPHSSTVSPSMSGASSNHPAPSVILSVLLPLGNAAFLSLALYSVIQDSGLHSALAWLMLALSALYLALLRPQATALARAIHLALAVIFLTVAIPLKASGQTLTTAWLVEGLVLFWASTLLQAPAQVKTKAPTRVLHLLAAAGYVLGLLSLAVHWFWFNDPSADTFFNANLGSALVAIAALAGMTWLTSGSNANEPSPNPLDLPPLLLSLIAIDLVALLLLLAELSSISSARLHPPFRTPEFADALVALAVLAAASWAAYRLARPESVSVETGPDPTPLWTLAASSFVAFNLFAILTMVREISALWTGRGMIDADVAVQRSLAISAFLMLYGAALLAAGFWRRSAFVRWQALLLLLFTILKVFLYDVSGLSQGYRVASFLGLGALLMAVSFAYQKDWLGLKTAPTSPTPEDPA